SNTSLAPLGSLAKLSVWLKFLNGPSSFPPFKSIKCNLQCSGCCFINTDTNNFRNSDLPNPFTPATIMCGRFSKSCVIKYLYVCPTGTLHPFDNNDSLYGYNFSSPFS